jgi:hypothetical protein
MSGIQVLNEYKSHARIDWKRPEQLGEGLQASRRGADADYPEGFGLQGFAARVFDGERKRTVGGM